MAHRTKEMTTPFKSKTISARITQDTDRMLFSINARQNGKSGVNITNSDTLAMIVKYYYDNVYTPGLDK